ncbi:MAG: TIM barrel protein [Candidatus Promineifilaceae bacterium]
MNVYLSTGAFQHRSLNDIIADCLKYNFQYLELSSGVQYEPDLLMPVFATQSKMNFLIHNYFPPPEDAFVLNLAAADPEIHAQSVEHCRRAIDLSRQLNAPFFSVHSGFAFYLTPEMLGDPVTQSSLPDSLYFPREQAYDIFVATVRELADYGRQRSVKLLLENNVVSPLYLPGGENKGLLLADASEIVRCMNDLSDSNVGLLLDTGHLKVSANALRFSAEKFIEQVGSYIGAIHLSENDAMVDNNQPFSETSWFWPFLFEFRHISWIIEVYRLDVSSMKNQISILEKCLFN